MPTPSVSPAQIRLTGELPQPITCCVCRQLVTLEQLQGGRAVLLWLSGAGSVVIHRTHLQKLGLTGGAETLTRIEGALKALEANQPTAVDREGRIV